MRKKIEKTIYKYLDCMNKKHKKRGIHLWINTFRYLVPSELAANVGILTCDELGINQFRVDGPDNIMLYEKNDGKWTSTIECSKFNKPF